MDVRLNHQSIEARKHGIPNCLASAHDQPAKAVLHQPCVGFHSYWVCGMHLQVANGCRHQGVKKT